MRFEHQYDPNGRHRLVLHVAGRQHLTPITGEWASFHHPAEVASPGRRRFVAFTTYWESQFTETAVYELVQQPHVAKVTTTQFEVDRDPHATHDA